MTYIVKLWPNFIQLYHSYVDASPFESEPRFSSPKFTVKDFQHVEFLDFQVAYEYCRRTK